MHNISSEYYEQCKEQTYKGCYKLRIEWSEKNCKEPRSRGGSK